MKWSRDMRTAKRSMRTMLRAVSSNLSAQLKMPSSLSKQVDFPGFGVFPQPVSSTMPHGHVQEIAEFGTNPGRLRMLTYTPPDGVHVNAPLVVVLHGCGQGAAEFAQGSGWTALADALCFTLVMPEQSGRNNQGRCFQWFQPSQTTRGEGEVLSIRQMVGAAVKRFNSDPHRVFVVGLSAGGAMAAAMLAAYPDVFAGGAVVAGLPVGAAVSTAQALMRMAHAGPERTSAEWAVQVESAMPKGYRRGWPRISVWHGTADTVVDPANADLLATQWGAVHGLKEVPVADVSDAVARRRTWSKNGETLMEQWSVAHMAHGYPIDAHFGKVAPYIVDAGLSATRHIAQFWGLM